MNNCNILTLNDAKKWRELLLRLPPDQQDIYFTPEYYQLYEKLGDGEARCFAYMKDQDIALYPFLLNSVNALGYDLDNEYFDIQGAYGYNGVVSSNYQHEFRMSFFKAFDRYCMDQHIVAEFTRFHPLLNNQVFFGQNMSILNDRKTVIVDLNKSESEIYDSFTSANKRSIKKAINNQIKINVYQKEFPDYDSFIHMYRETMNRVDSVSYLYFSNEYFRNLLSLNIVQFVAILDGKPISSTICLHSTNYFHYHLGCSKTEFLCLRPNNLLFWEMIKFAKKNGHIFLHLGGGNSGNENDTLLKYKSNFSNIRGDFSIGKKIHDPETYKEVVAQWQARFPEKTEAYKKHILKYRN